MGLGLALADGRLPDRELEPDLGSEMHLELWMVGSVRPLPLAGCAGEGLLAVLAAADRCGLLAAGEVLAVLAAGDWGDSPAATNTMGGTGILADCSADGQATSEAGGLASAVGDSPVDGGRSQTISAIVGR